MVANNYGLNDDLQYYEFELDSLDASGSGGNSASTDWPLFYIGGREQLRNIAAIKIIEAEIPFSWYVFNTSNNTFVLTEAAGGPVTVTLPVGNYTTDQLSSLIGKALSTASIAGRTYTVTYSTITQKFTFFNNAATTSPFTLTFGLPLDFGNTTARLYIGFPGGPTSSQTFSTSGTANNGDALLAPFAVQVTGPNYVYINSNRIGQLANLFLPKGALNLGGGNAGPQLAKVPVDVLPGQVVFWQDPDPQKWFDVENLKQLDSIDLFLTLGNTSNQLPLQLNGLGFSVKIGVLLNKSNHNNVQGQGGPGISRITR